MNPQSMCFMRTDGLHMTTGLAETLYRHAVDMAEGKSIRRDFRIGNAGEGCITTNYRTSVMGNYGGVRFDATVAIESRQFEVSFIIDTRYLDRFMPGYWTLMDAEPISDDPSMLN